MERIPYATDLSDGQWSLIEPLVTAWKQERVARSATGDPGSCDLREVVNALLYQNRTGCQWRLLPHDLPAWSAVFYYFTLWRRDGLDQRIQEILRCQVRERSRRLEDPSLVIIDTQSVRVAAGVPKETTGLDANKKTPGRKRGLAVDVLGLVIGVVILAASAHDNEAGIALALSQRHPLSPGTTRPPGIPRTTRTRPLPETDLTPSEDARVPQRGRGPRNQRWPADR